MCEKADPGRITGKVSGLSWEAERCPDASPDDALKTAFGGTLVGYGLGFLFGFSRTGRFLSAGLGACAGAIASRYHLNVDWDPDALRGEPASQAGGDDAPPPAEPDHPRVDSY